MTISTIFNFQSKSNIVQQDENQRCDIGITTGKLSYILLWRRNQLLVKPAENFQQSYLYRLIGKQSLVDCLKHSPVNLVRIDPQLSEEQLNLWANACEEANKPIYLRIPSVNKKNTISSLFTEYLQQSSNCLLVVILFVVLMPFILPLILWMHFYCQESLFTYEWCVGKRGKLFKLIKFNATDIQYIKSNKYSCISKEQRNLTRIMKMMHKYGVDKLPQLLNILRGEMRLFGSQCCDVRDAVRLSDTEQKQLNKMPGIISLYQINLHSKILNIDSQSL